MLTGPTRVWSPGLQPGTPRKTNLSLHLTQQDEEGKPGRTDRIQPPQQPEGGHPQQQLRGHWGHVRDPNPGEDSTNVAPDVQIVASFSHSNHKEQQQNNNNSNNKTFRPDPQADWIKPGLGVGSGDWFRGQGTGFTLVKKALQVHRERLGVEGGAVGRSAGFFFTFSNQEKTPNLPRGSPGPDRQNRHDTDRIRQENLVPAPSSTCLEGLHHTLKRLSASTSAEHHHV